MSIRHLSFASVFHDFKNSIVLFGLTARTNESCTFYEEHKLRLTLIDLGMKLVCVPRNIYENINKACQAMTPHDEDALDNQYKTFILCICIP
jgi:hypothetical protein